MASFLPCVLFTFTFISTSFFSINGVFLEHLSEAKQVTRAEQTTHLHFYFHDVLGGNSPTAIKIITGPPKASSTGLFGSFFMIDDALTEDQDASSKVVGRAQGFYSVASQGELAMLMVMNLEFEEGKYKGSSISVVGRNPVMKDVREMPIVGGSGVFRGARGYVLAHTVWFDTPTGDAIVEYNVYVTHDDSSPPSSSSTTSISTPSSSFSSSSLCQASKAFLLMLICFSLCIFAHY